MLCPGDPSLFFGAAFYINFAEQPARMQLQDDPLLTRWKPSCKRGFVMQASLAIVSRLSGVLAAYQTSQPMFVAGAALILANWPWTVFATFPLDHHGVRTALGCAAVVKFLVALRLPKT